VRGTIQVVIVGRPNVGKSSLFNRLIGAHAAVVEERPKVTRDVKASETLWCGRRLELRDTGGFLEHGSLLDAKVSHQVERAIAGADVVLFVVDVRTGATEEDLAVARLLRRAAKPVVLVANKVDDLAQEPGGWELARLGFGDPVMVSAIHGRNTGALLDAVCALVPPEEELGDEWQEGATVPETPEELKVALVGRPNVGKSTLFNRLVGEERTVVHDEPGTTVDTIDTIVEIPEGRLRFFDTAGLRRHARYGQGTEYYSMVRTLRAIDASDVVLLVIDAAEGVTGWDQRLAERIDAAGSAVVVVLNKWDLVDAEARRRVEDDVADRLAFVAGPGVLRVSGLTGRGVHRILPTILTAAEAYRSHIPTGELNRFFAKLQAEHPAREGRVLYAVQGAVNPPTFTLFVNRELPQSYVRFLEHQLRRGFGLEATPIQIRLRRRR